MPASRFPLVIFDLDGTLVDSFEDIRVGIRVALAAVGLEVTPELLALATRGVPLEDFFRAAACEPAADPERFAGFVDAYRAHYLPGCLTHTLPYPRIPETLRALRALTPAPKIAVATTKRSETAERVLAGTGLLS